MGNIFLFGNLLTKSDAILIQREDKKSLIELLKLTKNRLDKGKHLVIFPEGTRNKVSHKLLPFKAGAKIVAEKYNLKVQPIIITGAKRLLNEHNRTADNSIVKLKYLPTIDVDNLNHNWYKEIRESMQREIDIEYNNNNRPR